MQYVASPSGRGTLLFYCCVYQLLSKRPTGNSPHSASIHILDNDSLLNIFYLYRPVIIDGHEVDYWSFDGGSQWDLERWWYKLAQVCQRWRNLILGSASYLRLCLFCTNGTPVAEMLAHSPPLPLVFDYRDPDPPNSYISAEERDGIIRALEQRTRVSRIRFKILVSNLPDFIKSIDGEYPILEYLVVSPPVEDSSTALSLPETLQAPCLRHLQLSSITIPLGSQLFPTAVALVTLTLTTMGHPFTDFKPSILLQWLALMPQLEKLSISILYPNLIEDVESQLMHTPIVAHVTLPNLRWFHFHGDSAFEEALVCRMTTPRLERLRFWFVELVRNAIPIRLPNILPNLLHFMNTVRHLKFDTAHFIFFRPQLVVGVNSREDSAGFVFSTAVLYCWSLDIQVSYITEIFDSIGQIFSTVEDLAFEYEEIHEDFHGFDRTEWRKLLRPFSNVKTLHIDEELVERVSHCLRPDDGENPLELLPALQELTFSGSCDIGDAFTSFIDARRNAGRPVTMVFKPTSVTTPSRNSSQSSLESSSAMTWNSEVAEAGTWAGSDSDN